VIAKTPATISHYGRNARIIGVVVAILSVVSFISEPRTQAVWTWDPGLIIESALVGAAITGAIAYAIASVIGRLLARRH
jgi:hypothetical protein